MGFGRGGVTPIVEHAPGETVPTREFQPVPTSVRRSKPDRLIQVDGPGAPRDVVIGGGPLVIGRSEECDLRVESGHVSRNHAVIQRVGEDLELRDLDSRNGSWLNDLRVHAATLREGDTLQFGDALFIFRPAR